MYWTFPPTLVAASSAVPFGQILPLVLMFAVVYLLVLRPMSTQEKSRRKRVDALKKGDQVVLNGGLLGRIANLDDPKIAVVELADRIRVRVLRREIMDTQEAALKDEKGGSAAKDAKPAEKDEKAEKAEKSEKTEKSEKSEKSEKKDSANA